ncbi:hypothetical protein [Larkinella soli]|uniref:hypothetical protein n=1 Tax=Larkinella soli TaxID=1770527 RepID=UPI000FFB6824|nr:hypothetical protein [Larkinella soli]
MHKLTGLLWILLLPGMQAPAQTFRYRAQVPSPQKTGYHRILLPPGVVGRLNDGLTDLRLFDGNRHEIPYLITRERPLRQTRFQEFRTVSHVITPRVATTLVLQPPAKSRISSLGLVIKNANVRKRARLSGSNDARTWYGIEDEYLIEPVTNPDSTSELRLIDFPLSDYAYYRLEINDSLSAPLNILKAGFYASTPSPTGYTAIPVASVTRKDSLRQSFVRIGLQDEGRVDKLTLRVQAPAQYRRRASLVREHTRKGRRGRVETVTEVLRSFELNSSAGPVHTVFLNGPAGKELHLIIENLDSPPLELGPVEAFQATTYLTAELKPGAAYELRFSDPNAGAPAYDLVYFKDKIPADAPLLRVGRIETIQPGEPASAGPFLTSPVLIWGAIGLVLVLLTFLSHRMLSDMKSR